MLDVFVKKRSEKDAEDFVSYLEFLAQSTTKDISIHLFGLGRFMGGEGGGGGADDGRTERTNRTTLERTIRNGMELEKK